MNRRRFLISSALAAGAGFSTMRVAMAATQSPRFVFVILRGGLDGLAAVAPVGEYQYSKLRGELTLEDTTDLNGLFGLHPSLSTLAQLYQSKQLLIAHAVATPYRDRSHFDGQNVLEGGGEKPYGLDSGWLNRALSHLTSPDHADQTRAVALQSAIPLVLRGTEQVLTWSSGSIGQPAPDLFRRLEAMYASEPDLARQLDTLNQSKQLYGGLSGAGKRGGFREAMRDSPEKIFGKAGEFLTQPLGPRIAVIETDGWDTHANQGADQGQLANRLAALDGGIASLRDSLGSAWNDTVVAIASEFGRTAAINGSRGTDHGTAGVVFLAGGAVQGGRLIGEWPGLAQRSLYQGRDLFPANDLRAILKAVLMDHLNVPETVVETVVFPNSPKARPVDNLIS